MTNEKESSFWSTITYILSIYFILFPFVSVKSFLYGGTSFRSITLICLTTVLVSALVIWVFAKEKKFSIPKSPITIALGLYLISIFISGIIGLNFDTTFWSLITRTSGLWYLIHLGFLIFLLYGIFLNEKRQKIFVLSIILSGALYSFLAFFGPQGINVLFKNYIADGFTFWNSSFAGMYLFGSFLLSIWYLFQAEIKRWWMYALPILLVINPFLLSRNIWFGDFSAGFVGEAKASSYVTMFSVIALICAWAFSKIKTSKIQSIVGYSLFGIYVLGMIVFSISLFSQNGFVRQFYLKQSTSARLIVWEMSERAIYERPFFGWGGDNFDLVFQKQYDNRLLQDEFGREPWFDRAHNIFIDQAVDNGIVGLVLYVLAYFVIILSSIYTFINAINKKDRILSAILAIYFPLHLLELQTAFDTTISYPILAVMIAFAIVLFGKTYWAKKQKPAEIVFPEYAKYAILGVVSLFLIWSTFWGIIPLFRSQAVNGNIRTVGSSEKRIPMYPALLSTPVDEFGFLWRVSMDLQKGIAENPKVLSDAKKVEFLKKELATIEGYYKKFVLENPNHFRAKLNYADVLMYSNLFGVDKLKEAIVVLDQAIPLVPNSPQPYWLKAVAYIYSQKFDLAREAARKGLEINPQVKESQKIVEYVESSIKTFPEVDLYFFRQI